MDGSITVEHDQIKVPRIGWLKTYERLPQGIKPSSVTISKRAHRWFISFKIEIEAEKIAPKNNPIGLDFNVGYDAAADEFVDLFEAGVVDPTRFLTVESQVALAPGRGVQALGETPTAWFYMPRLVLEWGKPRHSPRSSVSPS